MFYTKRTVGEQALRLPSDSRGYYLATQLDRIKIDGEEILGYFEYSFLEEKSYKTQPQRSDDGSIPDLENYATFLTPRLIIRYNMMQIEDYRKLMKKLKAKNVFTVECYDIVEDKRVVHEMYFAPPQMPIIYQQYLTALGVQEYTIELIGTNRKTHLSVTYDYNFESYPNLSTWFSARFPYEPTKQTVGNIPYNKRYLVGNLGLSDDTFLTSAVSSVATLKYWSVLPYGESDTTLRYTDGVSYFLSKDMVLYAHWE